MSQYIIDINLVLEWQYALQYGDRVTQSPHWNTVSQEVGCVVHLSEGQWLNPQFFQSAYWRAYGQGMEP